MSQQVSIRPQPGKQTDFLYSRADVALYGGAAGSGKTYGLLLDAMKHVENPDYRAVIFRRTYPEINNPGGLWDESLHIYPLMNAFPQKGDHRWIFPSGAQIEFSSCQYEADLQKFQGMQVSYLGIDELPHFTRRMFFYLFSRVRSVTGIKPKIRMTCNPDADSWVAELVRWWVDQETGYAIEKRSGKIRCFANISDELYWGNTQQDLIEQHGEDIKPKSFTFIPATLADNVILDSADPDYRGQLMALPHVDQERLLRGNWKIKDNQGALWADKPEYFDSHLMTDHIPDAFEYSALAVDPATGPESGKDYSAVVFVGISGGLMWVDAKIERLSYVDLAQVIVDMWLQHRPTGFGSEFVGFQDLLQFPINEECKRRGIPPIIAQPISHGQKNKILRISRLEPHLAEKQIRILNNAGGQELFKQLRSIGIHKHDDGPDALDMARQLLYDMHDMMSRYQTTEPSQYL